MNNTPTPRTDEAQFGTGRVSVNFARQLERELTAVTEQRDRLAEALENNWELLIALHHYFDADYPIDVTLIHHAAKLTREALQSLKPDHTVAANDMIAAVKGGADES